MSTAAAIGLACVGACVGLGVVLTSCRSTRAPELLAEAPPSLRDGAVSAIVEERVVACRTRDEFAALWSKHARLQLPEPPLPQVDFDVHMVVAVFAGQRPTAGYGVIIEAVGAPAEDGAITVTCRETMPPEDGAQAQMVTSPFSMAAVDAAEGELELVWVD